jgi:acyl-CoA thioesterase-1
VLLYPFFLEGAVLNRSLMQPDGIHPNPAGVDAIVARITPLAERLVRQARGEHVTPTQK